MSCRLQLLSTLANFQFRRFENSIADSYGVMAVYRRIQGNRATNAVGAVFFDHSNQNFSGNSTFVANMLMYSRQQEHLEVLTTSASLTIERHNMAVQWMPMKGTL